MVKDMAWEYSNGRRYQSTSPVRSVRRASRTGSGPGSALGLNLRIPTGLLRANRRLPQRPLPRKPFRRLPGRVREYNSRFIGPIRRRDKRAQF